MTAGSNVALIVRTAGADRQMTTCSKHLLQVASRGRVVQILDEHTHDECGACKLDAARKLVAERQRTVMLSRAGCVRWGASGDPTGYDGSYNVWFAFGRRLSDEVAVARLERAGVSNLGEQRCGHSYDCCACWFSDGPWVRRSGSWTLVRQSWARNV